MKHLVLTVFVSFLVEHGDARIPQVCRTNRGENLIQFNGRVQDVHFPCKYWALRRQRCGRFLITLSPGNRWIFPKYQLDTLWLGVKNTENGDFWLGRTSNKIAVKYVNSGGATELFRQKDGNISTSPTFTFSTLAGVTVAISDIFGDFQVTFTPWDPRNTTLYPNAEWSYVCFNVSGVTLREYPKQMCGGAKSRAVAIRARQLGVPKRFREIAIYFDTFTNPRIAQNNPDCDRATDILVCDCSDDEQRILALKNCKDILHSKPHARCVSRYACDPMDVFIDCLRWGCAGQGFPRSDKSKCAAVAEGIDFCPVFAGSGNLTERVRRANCFRDFIPIDDNGCPK